MSEDRIARVSFLPEHTGDGYGYGGGTILTIGKRSILFGDEKDTKLLAQEIADAWNERLQRKEQRDNAE